MKILMKMKLPMKKKKAKIRRCLKKSLIHKLRIWKDWKKISKLKFNLVKNLQMRIMKALKVNKTRSRRNLYEWKH